jgi:hypothetical protein
MGTASIACEHSASSFRDPVDPGADGKTTHAPGSIRLQQIRYRTDIEHPRIKPEIIVGWVEDDGHTVVDSGGEGVLCQGNAKASCCTKDEGGPFEAAL